MDGRSLRCYLVKRPKWPLSSEPRLDPSAVKPRNSTSQTSCDNQHIPSFRRKSSTVRNSARSYLISFRIVVQPSAQLNGMNPEHLFSSGVVSVADRAPRTDQQPAPPSGPSPVGSHPVSRGGRAPFDRGDPLRAVRPKFLSASATCRISFERTVRAKALR